MAMASSATTILDLRRNREAVIILKYILFFDISYLP